MDGFNLSLAYRKMSCIPVSFITANDDGVEARQTLWLDLTECSLRYVRTDRRMCKYFFTHKHIFSHNDILIMNIFMLFWIYFFFLIVFIPLLFFKYFVSIFFFIYFYLSFNFSFLVIDHLLIYHICLVLNRW